MGNLFWRMSMLLGNMDLSRLRETYVTLSDTAKQIFNITALGIICTMVSAVLLIAVIVFMVIFEIENEKRMKKLTEEVEKLQKDTQCCKIDEINQTEGRK